jgi:hypothetical protein
MRDDYSHLVGHRLPTGRVSVPRLMNRLWADSALGPDPAPYVHPVLVYFAAIEGSNLRIQDLFDLMEAPADSGVVMGEQKLTFRAPLEVEREYEVDGEVVDVVRKQGRRAGAFDVMTIVFRLREDGGSPPLAESTITFIFPRAVQP